MNVDYFKTDGFMKDVNLLIERFKSKYSVCFSIFCDEWKEQNFHYIFFGFLTEGDMIKTIEQYLLNVKKILITSKNIYERVAALYLLYAIYFKQPPREYCKIRTTSSEWNHIKEFYQIELTNLEQPKLIFWKLVAAGAFLFVESLQEYTLEYLMLNEDGVQEVEYMREHTQFYEEKEKILMDENKGIVPALEILQDAYNEMKDILIQKDASTSKASKKSLGFTNCMSEIRDGLKNISSIFELNDFDGQSEEESELMVDESDCDDDDHGEFSLRRNLKMKAARGGESPKKKLAKDSGSKKRRPEMCFDTEREVLEISYPSTTRRGNKHKSLIQREIECMPNETFDELRVPVSYKNSDDKKPLKSMEQILGV